MRRHELAIEQLITAHPQPRDQPGHGDFGGIARPAEHALTEKNAAKREAV